MSFVFLSIFDEIDVGLTKFGIFASYSGDRDEAYRRAVDFAWRFKWFFQPLIVFLVAVGVTLLDRSKYSLVISIISVTPFLFLNLLASSFSFSAVLFTSAYIAVVTVTVLTLQNVLTYFNLKRSESRTRL